MPANLHVDAWINDLRADLHALTSRNRLRRLRPIETTGRHPQRDGRALVNLASNDYLGLADHPHLKDAACCAIQDFGTGVGASRLTAGHLALHERVEQRFARFKHAEAALLFPTGYMANLATLTALAGPGDLICVDKLNHASLLDAARLSGATVRVYPHLNTVKLARLLDRHQKQTAKPRQARPCRRLIVTDGVFSMDGDVADLPTLCDLADRYEAILIVDDAHGTGVLGDSGAGLCEHQQVTNRVDVVVSTASKALGGLGGVVTAGRDVIDTLINRARPFIYTTGTTPAQTAALDAALDLIDREPDRRQRLATLAIRTRQRLIALAHPAVSIPATPTPTPIIPLVAGTDAAALSLAAHLEHDGFLAPAIRPPTVAPDRARVRLSLRADLDDYDLDRLVHAISCWKPTANDSNGLSF